jgi:hypothetical protein
MGVGDMWRDDRAVRRLKVSTARVMMEGLWLSDAKKWEMERESWRMESSNGARCKPIGAISSVWECVVAREEKRCFVFLCAAEQFGGRCSTTPEN